jgi:hypothetical protein
MATELERYAVEITLVMKTSFYMQIVRSKCKKGAAVYQNRGEAVSRTADVSDIVKRSPDGDSKALIEFNKWRRSLYKNCGNKLQETSRNILLKSSTLQQLEKDKELTRNNNNKVSNKMNSNKTNSNNRKNGKTKITTTATVTGGTPILRNPYSKRKTTHNHQSNEEKSNKDKRPEKQRTEKHNNNNNNSNNNSNNNLDDETLTQSTADTSRRSAR